MTELPEPKGAAFPGRPRRPPISSHVPSPPTRDAVKLMTGAAAAGLGAAVFMWLPWVTVSTSPDSFGDPGVQLSIDGFHTFPTTCVITCAGVSTSVAGVLFMLACAAVIAAVVGWIRLRDKTLATAAVAASSAAVLLAMIDAIYLLADTGDKVGADSGISMRPGAGAVLAILAASGSLLMTGIATRRISAR